MYNDISEISVNETALFLDDSTSQPVTLPAQVNSSESWQITISNRSDNSVVAQSSGTGPGTASISWTGSGATPGIYDLSISPGVVSSGGGVSPTDCYVGVSYAIGSDMLIMGFADSQDAALDRNNRISEMGYVADACLERAVKYTMILDPQWYTKTYPNGWIRPDPITGTIHRGMDYWLGGRLIEGCPVQTTHFRDLFLNTHGSIDPCLDGAYRTCLAFADGCGVYYSNKWEGYPARDPAFTDYTDPYGLGAYPWNIVEINACWSAGNSNWVPFVGPVFSNEPDYVEAFGLGNRDVNGGVFVGWSRTYVASSVPNSYNGQGWTQDFWCLLGEDYTVGQAVAYNPALGMMSNWLVVDDDLSSWITWLEWW